MTAKSVLRRKQAQRDIEKSADYYFEEGGVELELRFLDALQTAVRPIGDHPGVGSPRYAQPLGIAGLRFWKLTRFPHLIFYVEREDHLDIWRVLHEERDIPARFGEEDGPTD